MTNPQTTPALRFQWKDREDNFHLIDEMATRHLFFTLRMIWNHSMPEDARSVGYHKYRFGSFYTDEYMKDAIKAICRELGQRTDMQATWQFELDRFVNYLISKKTLLEAA